MKKSTAAAIILTLCASQAWAYENPTAGYSIKDKNPFLKMESKKIYAFSNFSSQPMKKIENLKTGSAHVVNYYTAEEMSQILGEQFSTAYFDAQYEKLALLQRSELNLHTVPTPLLERERYVDFEEKNNVILNNQFIKKGLEKIVPIIRLDKICGKKAITLSFLYKQNDALMATDTTLLSANDRLYLLTTCTSYRDHYTAEEEQVDTTDKPAEEIADILDAAEIEDVKEALGEAMVTEQIKPDEIDANVLKGFWVTHTKFVKGFKALVPSAAASPLAYNDAMLAKNMHLPDDWFYGQIQFKEKEAKGNLTIAASLPTMKKIANDIDYGGIFNLLGVNAKDSQKTNVEQAALNAKAEEEARKALTLFDALLLTCSFQTKDKDLQEMTSAFTTDETMTNILLDETLNNLKHLQSENFALTDYNYKLQFKQRNTVIDVNTKLNLLQQFDLNNLLRFAGNSNAGIILFYLHKPDWESNAQMAEDISQWQF